MAGGNGVAALAAEAAEAPSVSGDGVGRHEASGGREVMRDYESKELALWAAVIVSYSKM